MLRTLALVALAMFGCESDATRQTSPAPAVHPPPSPVQPTTSRTIRLEWGGLAVWRGQTCGCLWRVEVDVAKGTVVATDPDGKPWTRALEPAELRDLGALADAALSEPKTNPQGQGADSGENLAITDGSSTFEVHTNGAIQRPAAAKLVSALNAAARWPKVD